VPKIKNPLLTGAFTDILFASFHWRLGAKWADRRARPRSNRNVIERTQGSMYSNVHGVV